MRVDELSPSPVIWGIPRFDISELVGERSRIVVPEMRPYMLGVYVLNMFPYLRGRAVYITDNMLGHLAFRGKLTLGCLFFIEDLGDGVLAPPGGLYFVRILSFHGVPLLLREGVNLDPSQFKDRDAGSLFGLRFYDNPRCIRSGAEFIPKSYFTW